jgi:hypothetical protein
MRLPAFRFSIRSSMIALAVAAVLTSGGMKALGWIRLRADYLQQVENYRFVLGETEEHLAEAQACLADPDEQALLAELPDDQRAAWIVTVDQLRRSREVYAAAIPRWQRLADHPWEPTPADLYRVD